MSYPQEPRTQAADESFQAAAEQPSIDIEALWQESLVPEGPFGIPITRETKNHETREGVIYDIYDNAETFLDRYYPQLVDEFSAFVKAQSEKDDTMFHFAIITRMPFILYSLKGDSTVRVMLPNINCSESGLDALKVELAVNDSQNPRSYRFISSKNLLIGDYLDFADESPDEIYHIKDKDDAAYLVLSATGMFRNDTERRELKPT